MLGWRGPGLARRWKPLRHLARVAPIFYKSTGLFQRDRRSYFELMTGMIQTSYLSPPERMAGTKRWEARFEALPSTAFVTKMICPGMAGTTGAFLRGLATVRTAAAAVAIERYRLGNGALPETFDALVPTWLEVAPQDPFNGEALHYKMRERGYVVYSVGEDLTDDGGKGRNDRGKRVYTDVTFYVER
ncbi:unnamed protein product [marine sediment metagenome]|uniref:Uncharacterized protein n=1 Tax=marine sediment metagenome TaxID=412755 RepID=X0XME4_9ZZZZ